LIDIVHYLRLKTTANSFKILNLASDLLISIDVTDKKYLNKLNLDLNFFCSIKALKINGLTQQPNCSKPVFTKYQMIFKNLYKIVANFMFTNSGVCPGIARS